MDGIGPRSFTGGLKGRLAAQEPDVGLMADAPGDPPGAKIPRTALPQGTREAELAAFVGTADQALPWEVPQQPAAAAPKPAPALAAAPPKAVDAEIGAALTAQITKPAEKVIQAFDTSCMAAATQMAFAMSQPDAYRQLAEGLWTQGRASVGGHDFSLKPGTLKQLKALPGPSANERLNAVVQAAFMEFANGRLEFDAKKSLSVDGKGREQDGLNTEQSQKLADALGIPLSIPEANKNSLAAQRAAAQQQRNFREAGIRNLAAPEIVHEINEQVNALPEGNFPAIVALPSRASGMRHAYVVFNQAASAAKKIVDPQVGKPFDYNIPSLTEMVNQTLKSAASLIGGARVRKATASTGDGGV